MRHARNLLAVLGTMLAMVWGHASIAAPFINEIHYDNDGTDAGEAIEIAGPAGTDLAGWSIVLYNGNGGASYSTLGLSGLIPNQQNGFGTVAFNYPTNGIQNGAPDGIALVNGSTVVQFLSYEGTFTAVGGPADGMTSTDIGVSESSSTAVGHSVQLSGTGSIYADFTWSASAPNTFGLVNTNQLFLTSLGGLVISEVDYDQPGTDNAEFIELFNRGSTPLDLSAFTIELINGTGGGASAYSTILLPAKTLAPGEYFVVCGSTTYVLNCDFDGGLDTNLIQNGAPDAIGLRTTDGVLVDTLSYEGDTGIPYTEGSGVGLEDDPSTPFLGLSRSPDGTDTNVNNLDFSSRCITPGLVNTLLASGCADPAASIRGLVINEVDYDQPGTDTAEFIELFNSGSTPLDLSGFKIELFNGTGSSVYVTILLPATTLAPGEYFVICGNSIYVINCDLDGGSDTNLIQNGGPDAIALRTMGGFLVDVLSYEGDATAPYTEGSGAGLLDDPTLSFYGLSRFPNGGDTNVNNLDFSGRCITPGFANSSTTTVCPDPATLQGVAEPATIALLGLGIAGLALTYRRKRPARGVQFGTSAENAH